MRRLSGDLLNAYRVEAEKLGIGYQTLMQIKLKEGLENTLVKRLEKLEKAMKVKARGELDWMWNFSYLPRAIFCFLILANTSEDFIDFEGAFSLQPLN